MADAVAHIALHYVVLPLARPVSDAKVLTGRQLPLTEVAFTFAEITSREGHHGLGFTHAKRAGGPGQFEHAKELAPHLLGQDPNDIARLWERLSWAGAAMGRGGMAAQAIAPFDIALWDLKARRAGLSLAKLLGAHRDEVRCYNTSGGFLSTPLAELLGNVEALLARGIGGIKLKVGQPEVQADLDRVAAVHRLTQGRCALMVDANQQWSRPTAQRFGQRMEDLGLAFIEEPLSAQDAEGHAALAALLATPIASGEMLTSVAECLEFIQRRGVDVLQPDTPRVGGITPMLRITALAEQARIHMAPHFAMELNVHLAAACELEPWVEHFDWLEPLFNERLHIEGGRMQVPTAPGLNLSLSDQARGWTRARAEFGQRP